MGFGMVIRTSDGMQSIAAMRAARLQAVHVTIAAAGSVDLSGFDSARGFIYQTGGGGPSGLGRMAFNLQRCPDEGRA